jgi:Asp-tRNA(Asn)/Glu-tRNA(Gln) amidotransferase B subunit
MQQFASEMTAMNVPIVRPAQMMAQTIVEETESENDNDDEMIEGVIEILRGIGDMDNRQRSAEERLADFAEQGVDVDRDDFLRKVMETTITTTMAAPEENVANTALNGAQVQSLVQIINQVGLGVITQQTAKPLIEAAFPGIAERTIDDMLAGVKPLTSEQAQQV